MTVMPTAATLGADVRPETASPVDERRFPVRARLALRALGAMPDSRLRITFPDGQTGSFGRGIKRHADMHIHHWNCFDAIFRFGDIGFAETYIDEGWTTTNLHALLDLLVANRHALDSLVRGSWWGRLAYRLRHLLNRNSRAGSKRNIHAHYDIGNNFYKLWLDSSMTYSSALFASSDSSTDAEQLAEAQRRKYQRMLDEVRCAPGSHILEIGCGWGGFAETAVRAGQHVTGLTLSSEQLTYARQRCMPLLQPGQICDLRLQDYRDCSSQFDAVVSIEMFEAVGESYWPSYFKTLRHMLKPGGRACIQTIVIDDSLFEQYRKGSDFIQQYVFPGGMLPSPSAFRMQAEAAGMTIETSHFFGIDYARTLDVWRDRFLAAARDVMAQGFDHAFLRTWDLYLCYCAAAFRHGNTDVAQFTLVTP